MDITEGQLRLKEGVGWQLKWDDSINCHHCGKAIAPPFFWCKQFNVAFCRDCERTTGANLCHTMQKEHIHYNIVEVKK